MLWLRQLGAEVYGMALPPDTTPALFNQLELGRDKGHFVGDIRDADLVRNRMLEVAPDIVLHLAAQPLVLRSYCDPLETWNTNVMGTAHILDALKGVERKMAVVCITTDKVYENDGSGRSFAETDRLGGHDPYSASKAGSELVIDSYHRSFFNDSPVRIASARAGNVIGGGDWAENRVLPDLARAMVSEQVLELRNPSATRPWQHVLDPLAGYLRLAEALWQGEDVAGAFNFGPAAEDERPVRDLVEQALRHWPAQWRDASSTLAPHEAGRLALNTDKARMALGWQPRWTLDVAIEATIDWYKAVHEGADPRVVTTQQIQKFAKEAK
jgi:CDP-glucose 4,6-dehydratase